MSGSTVKIDKDVPLPSRSGFHSKYPWEEMEVGDSFMMEGKTNTSAHGHCYQWNKKLAPKKFVARKIEGGCRVWRIK